MPQGVGEHGVSPYFNVKRICENLITPEVSAIAIEDAIGVRIRDLPITAEKVYAAMREVK